jgi:predicted DNA binding CopG/RHH family protein
MKKNLRNKKTLKKKIPNFKSEATERKFWETHDSTEYLDWSQADRAIFPNLKLSTETISLRLPQSMLSEIKLLANKRDVPYQSLIKVFLRDRLDREIGKHLA